MDFSDSPAEAAFRAEVRVWLDANARRISSGGSVGGGVAGLLAEGGADSHEAVSAAQAWQRTLYEGGWAGITWPAEYGGRDLSPIQAFIWNEELGHYDVPPNIFGIGLGMIGPTIIAHGTEEQKNRYLAQMLSGDEVWCQLWSEPGAGSDLASLRTKAERIPTAESKTEPQKGDGWAINGQKVWTSGAHYSRFGLMIARTDPEAPKHRGITCFIVDMKAPGIEVRPLRQMTGASNFNEVFLTDVRIPDSNRVGEINDGWRVALTVLMNERLSVTEAFDLSGLVDPLLALARGQQRKEGRAIDDAAVRQSIADTYIRAKLLTLTGYRTVTKIARGSIPGPEGSIAKLVWADLLSDIARRGLDLLGESGLVLGGGAPDEGMWSDTYLLAPGIHLGGGTDEMMRNIIGERVLGLPKEPSVDKGVPFREIGA